MTDHLTVSSIFGPTFQGEGPSVGRRTAFLRLGLCNLDCSWCDQPETWDWTGKNGPAQNRGDLQRMSVVEVAAAVMRLGCDRLVVTGGEPMLQASGLAQVLARLFDRTVEVETNGTLPMRQRLAELVDQWNVSPKLPHSGVPLERAWTDRLRGYSALPTSICKVVVRERVDCELAVQLAGDYGWGPDRVWLMPEGVTAAQVQQRTVELADVALGLGANLGTRLHVLAWEGEGDR